MTIYKLYTSLIHRVALNLTLHVNVFSSVVCLFCSPATACAFATCIYASSHSHVVIFLSMVQCLPLLANDINIAQVLLIALLFVLTYGS